MHMTLVYVIIFIVHSTSSRSVYKACTWIKVNFDHLFLLNNYELYVIKIISLETSFKYEFNDIIFSIYISFCVGKNWWLIFFLNCVRTL
jgi:hypothetical protein